MDCLGFNFEVCDFNQRQLKKSPFSVKREVDGQETLGVLPWRMWSNGYDVRLWRAMFARDNICPNNASELANSVKRGFDSPLSPLTTSSKVKKTNEIKISVRP